MTRLWTGIGWSQLFALLGITTIAGCAVLEGYPDEEPDALSVQESDFYLSAAGIRDYNDSPTKTKRDNILNARMLAIDRNFLQFQKELYKQGVAFGLSTDVLLLIIGGATATVGTATTKSILGAVSTGVTGGKAAFDKQALLEKSLTAIIAEMKAQRAEVEVTLRTGMQQPLEQYPLRQGLSDVAKYYEAGTLPAALNGLVKSANIKAAKAEENLKQLQEGVYAKDNAGDLLRAFWKPDGKTINVNNQKKLLKCMEENQLPTVPGAISAFIRHEAFGEARVVVLNCVLK